jgi:hypothetical protein
MPESSADVVIVGGAIARVALDAFAPGRFAIAGDAPRRCESPRLEP